MECNFTVGDPVVCVRPPAAANRMYIEIEPVVGDVYTVREILCCSGVVSILLMEIHNAPQAYLEGFCEVCFTASRFRPVRKTDISVFERLLVNLPIMEDAR